MKKHLCYGLFLLSFTGLAQSQGSPQMQQMMQQMQTMQNCMANIDQAEMSAFQQQAEAMDSEVKALCAAGKRDAAMARAMAFGKETVHSKLMQQMKTCGEGMQNLMPQLPKAAQANAEDSKPGHVCDQ